MSEVSRPSASPASVPPQLLRLLIAAACVAVGLAVLYLAGVLSKSDTDADAAVEPANVNIVTLPVAGRSVGLSEGNVAPDFEFSTFDGRRMKLSDLRGRPVLVNFWASWCIPCRAEMPDIEGALQTYAPQRFAAVGVNNGERYKVAREFLDKVGVRFTAFAYDAEAAIAKRYGVQGMPTSYFIDAQGVITFVVLGPLTAPIMENGVKSAIAGAR